LQKVIIDYEKETNPPVLKDTYQTPRRYTYKRNPYRRSVKEAMEHSIFISEDAHRAKQRYAMSHSHSLKRRTPVLGKKDSDDPETEIDSDSSEDTAMLSSKKVHEPSSVASSVHSHLAVINEIGSADEDDTPSFITQANKPKPASSNPASRAPESSAPASRVPASNDTHDEMRSTNEGDNAHHDQHKSSEHHSHGHHGHHSHHGHHGHHESKAKVDHK